MYIYIYIYTLYTHVLPFKTGSKTQRLLVKHSHDPRSEEMSVGEDERTETLFDRVLSGSAEEVLKR